MKTLAFPKGFIWGAATASYQIEGAAFEDCKGESIWDRFSHTPGMIADRSTGDDACDHYHLYGQDVALMKQLGLQAYRLSLSWPRIFPDGTGKPNPQGVEFYKKLLRLLRENGIKTAVTLYHWDLPQKLQDAGGWVNRQISDDFEHYARFVFKELDGLVDWWITLNEPYCTSFMGYWQGVHAPGHRDFSSALSAAHHLLLSHGKAVRTFREMGTKGEIGITLNMNEYYPLRDCDEDSKTAELCNAAWNLWFSDPIFKGCYPETALEQYRDKVVLPAIMPEDFDVISSLVDFLGLNNYFGISCTVCESEWPLGVKQDFFGENRTHMNWGVNPDGLYKILMRLHERYPKTKLYITENGCAFNDIVDADGKVEDNNRVDYYRRYLAAAHRAIADGVDLRGYFAWSLLDNFEWAYGYSKRFGLIYVDYKTQKRLIKKSGYWYRDAIAQNGLTALE